MPPLSPDDEAALVRLATALVDQQRARVLIAANQHASGFWFGGGNVLHDADGSLLLVGRYRNAGDSRTGVAAGERGLELAVFRAASVDAPFEKVLHFTKAELDVADERVLSIEGAALRRTAGGYELFVSTEKDGIGYPGELSAYLKPGTGVWTIDRLTAPSLDALAGAPVETVLTSRDPRYLHVKDPFLYTTPAGNDLLLFCTHPYSWTSSNTGYAPLRDGRVVADEAVFDFFPRGTTWDVAITRGTCVVDVPRQGRFHDRNVSLLFYDGGESIRNLDEHAAAIRRPRGYSCEEIGGLAYLIDGDLHRPARLSRYAPLFTSPHGTGCSRYVDVVRTETGMLATWQQAQADGSQPLVGNFLTTDEVARLLDA